MRFTRITRGRNTVERKFLGVKDVCEITGRKQSYCYGVIRKLNAELKEQGYITQSGIVPAWYFYERTGIGTNFGRANEAL